MSPTTTLAIVLVVAQQPPAPTPSVQPVATPFQVQSRPATFLQSDEGIVFCLAFSTDGKTLAAGHGRGPSTGGGVVLWDVAGRKAPGQKSLPVTEGFVRRLAFSPDCKTLAAGYDYVRGTYRDSGIVLWDVAERKRVMQASLPMKKGLVEDVVFSPDGKTLAAGYVEGPRLPGGVVLWDVAGRQRLVEKSLPVTYGVLTSAEFRPSANILATSYTRIRGTPGGGVVLWDVAGRKLLIQATLPEARGQVARVAFAPDGKTLAAACGLEARNVVFWDSVVLWDVVSRKRVMQAPLPVRACPGASLAFTPDGKTLAAAYVRDPGLVRYDEAARQLVVSVTLWDVAEHKLVVEESLPVTYGSVTTVALSPDCKTLAAGYDYVRQPHQRWRCAALGCGRAPKGKLMNRTSLHGRPPSPVTRPRRWATRPARVDYKRQLTITAPPVP